MNLSEHIKSVREAQKTLTSDERMKLWEELQEGYCPHCGDEYLPPRYKCYCMNDE